MPQNAPAAPAVPPLAPVAEKPANSEDLHRPDVRLNTESSEQFSVRLRVLCGETPGGDSSRV
jgi:hypothetical protein